MNAPAALVEAFERACADAQAPATRAAAERDLAVLTDRPDAVAVAVAVAAQTRQPVARFHAAGAIRTAALSRWMLLPAPQRVGPESLRDGLVRLVVGSPALLPFERRALLRTAAALTRRAFMEEDPAERANFFAQICTTAAAQDSPRGSSIAALELMELLVEEFLEPTFVLATAGIEREMFARTRAQFVDGNGDLARLFHGTLNALAAFVAAVGAGSMRPDEMLERSIPALATLAHILGCETAVDTGIANGSRSRPDMSTASTDAVVVRKFSPGWRDVVDKVPETLRLAFQILAAARSQAHSDVAMKARQVVIASAAISRVSYASDDDSSAVLGLVLSGVSEQRWIASANVADRLAYAEVWRHVSCAHGLPGVAGLGHSELEMYAQDTCDEMDANSRRFAEKAAAGGDDDDIFTMDSVDMLLETWANFALQGDDASATSGHALESLIERVVIHFIQMSLRSSVAVSAAPAGPLHADDEEDFGYDDFSLDESRLAAAAVLTRFAIAKTAAPLAESLRDMCSRVFSCSGSPQPRVPLHVMQEDVHFLIELIAALVADDSKGETPTVPRQFVSQQHEANGSRNGPDQHTRQEGLHSAELLVSALFEAAAAESKLLELRGPHCEEASPRVGGALLEALARISCTYLVPAVAEDEVRAFSAVGGRDAAANFRARCLAKALEGVTLRGFEEDVAKPAAFLFATLSIGSAKYQDVRDSHVWTALAGAGAEAYQTLDPAAVQDIARALTNVFGDAVAERLVLPISRSLLSFGQLQDSLPDAAERAIATINFLRGATRSSELGPHTQHALLATLSAPAGSAFVCAKAFRRNRADVARAVIGLTDDLVCTRLSLLSEQESTKFIGDTVTLIREHAEHVQRHAAELSIDEVAADASEILELLQHLLDERAAVDIGDASFYGLSILLPILSESLLAHPAIRKSYFGFVTRLVAAHPSKVVQLPSDLCGRVVQSIDMEISSVESDSARRGLEALTAIARERAWDRKAGPGSTVLDGALERNLDSILNGLASGGSHTDNLGAAADALLPLIHCGGVDGSGGRFQKAGHALITQSGNSVGVTRALEELANAAAIANTWFGFNGRPLPQNDQAMVLSMRKQVSKGFHDVVSKFSLQTRHILLEIALR